MRLIPVAEKHRIGTPTFLLQVNLEAGHAVNIGVGGRRIVRVHPTEAGVTPRADQILVERAIRVPHADTLERLVVLMWTSLQVWPLNSTGKSRSLTRWLRNFSARPPPQLHPRGIFLVAGPGGDIMSGQPFRNRIGEHAIRGDGEWPAPVKSISMAKASNCLDFGAWNLRFTLFGQGSIIRTPWQLAWRWPPTPICGGDPPAPCGCPS